MADIDKGHSVSVGSYTSFTPQAVVEDKVDGVRKVTVTTFVGGRQTELTSIVHGGASGGVDMDRQNEMDGRLREVERAVTRIEETLKHMPTTLQMWAAVAAVLVPVAGALWWIVQAYLGPILEKAVVP